MVAPSGWRGVHSLPKAAALGGLDEPAQHVSRTAERRLLGMNAGDLEALFGVEFAISSLSRQPLLGITPMPRHARSVTSKTSASSCWAGMIALVADDALVGVLDVVSPRFQLDYGAADPSSRSSGSKPVTTMGISYFSASGGYSQ